MHPCDGKAQTPAMEKLRSAVWGIITQNGVSV